MNKSTMLKHRTFLTQRYSCVDEGDVPVSISNVGTIGLPVLRKTFSDFRSKGSSHFKSTETDASGITEDYTAHSSSGNDSESPTTYKKFESSISTKRAQFKSEHMRLGRHSVKLDTAISYQQRPTTVSSNREIVSFDNTVSIRKYGRETSKKEVKINGFVYNLENDTISSNIIQANHSKKTNSGDTEHRLPIIGISYADKKGDRHWKLAKSRTRDRNFYDYPHSTLKSSSTNMDEQPEYDDMEMYKSHVNSGFISSMVTTSSIPTDSMTSSDTALSTEDREHNILSISDSDECDTDLDIDENFGKEIVRSSDTYIGRTVYERECEIWQTAPQRIVIRGLGEKSITLRNKSLGWAAVPPLCTALRENLRVERLNLDGVDVTDDGIQYIAEMLLENITISYLNLANNNLGMRASQLLGHVMIVTENITHLNLSGNNLSDNSSWYLSTGIGTNVSITNLNLSYNVFGEQGGVLLGTGLARNTKLLNLNISWNKVRGKGAVAIFQALMVNNTLEVLDISWNGLGYEGAVALSKCLKRNKGLRDLDVSNNRLDWRCSPLVSEGLRSTGTLTKLKVGYNPLTTTGCMDILDAVATEDSVISLLDCSEVPVVGEADLLAATISRRRKFQFIHGGIVSTNDKVGEPAGRELNPMLRIIEYLRLLGLRPLELMKSFDKSSSFELPRKEFVEQIKKIGVKLHTFEIEALANSVSGKGYNKNVINYRKLSKAVREVVTAERERKMKEQREWAQIKNYHENILRKGKLDYISKAVSPKITGISGNMTDIESLKVNSVHTSGLGASRTSLSSKTSPFASKVQLSMCDPLDSTRSMASIPNKKTNKLMKRRKSKV